MINVKEEKMEMRGNLSTLLSEYTLITRALHKSIAEHESEEFAQFVLKRAYDLGCMSDEEIDKELELVIEKFEKSSAAEFLRNLFFGGAKHDPD